MKHKFLVHKHGDHVGVAVADIAPNEKVCGIYMDDDSVVEISARDSVPFGHKIAVRAVRADANVIEYGFVIGISPNGFDKGCYVHTHNLKSARW
jgi:(2R)-sulfolactate sulfo-lyase subunit alpha